MSLDKGGSPEHKTKKPLGLGWDALDKSEKKLPRSWNIDLHSKRQGNDITTSQSHYHHIPLNKIHPDPNQPRRVFNLNRILSLAQSISDPDVGLIEPIVVRPNAKGGYQIIAGERRFRACQSLKHETIKAIVLNVTDRQAYKISIIENLNRENLNPIEKAHAFKILLDKNIFRNQTEMAAELSITRTSLVKSLRLLERLSDAAIETYIANAGHITEGHLQAVMRAPLDDQKNLVEDIKVNKWTVRQTRQLITSSYFPKHRAKTIELKEKREDWFDLGIHVRPTITLHEIDELLLALELTMNKLDKLAKEKEETSD